MSIPDDDRDQVLIFSPAERGYLIDAMMVLMHTVDELPVKWHWEQRQELDILLQHLMRTDEGKRPEHRLLGKQVTVILDPDDSHGVSHGQLLGYGEEGTVEILEDDGFIHYCWPMLEIRERYSRSQLRRIKVENEAGSQHRQAGQG